MTSADALSAHLAELFGRRFCVLTGNGTTAIDLALRAIQARSGTGEVIIPAIACPVIPQAVQYAGFTPRFVDVRLDDFTIDAASAVSAISERTRAIIPVHLYGHAYDVEAIRALGVPVIEDAAQSMGGRRGDALLGTFGDFAILSFGSGKILDAGGGGALLFDDADAFDVVRDAAAQLRPAPASPDLSLETLSHWQLYHGTMNYLRVHPEARIEAIWQRAAPLFADLYHWAFAEELAARVEAGVAALSSNRSARLHRAERYHAGLAGLPIARTEGWRESGSVWRYSFLASSRQETNRISAALRAGGVNASNHYWSLADLFDGDKSLRNAQEVGSRVINLWVDARATDEAIDRACALLTKLTR